MSRPRKTNDPSAPATAADRHRQRMAQRSRDQFEAVADIGEIPAVVDPARKEACRLDLHRFLTTYFPRSTGLKPFSGKQVEAIARIQQCVLDGGLFLNAMPRGFVKTTISENAVLWATLYGHRKFVPIFGADADAADGNIDSIKVELSDNDLLMEDFPEACHAIRALEGKPQRCGSQTYQGELTHIEWRADTVVLPTVPGSPASGAIICASGIMGASRGMKHKRPDGTQQRPDFVLLDDPQTDESARTPLQVGKRINVIRKSILKLGGHNRKIAGVMNATVIQRGDMVEQVMNPKKFPAWQSMRVRMVDRWADAHETLWMEEYARRRNTFDRNVLGDQQRAHAEATEFYRLNRAKMDAGCAVTWEHCYDETCELSAVQHAYNLLIDDGAEVFASECQNEPLEERAEGQQDAPDADAIAAKLNRLPRGVVPGEASRLVGFVDVHDHVLYWMVCGFGDGFGGGVVDYGTWPDQKRAYFAHREAKRTIAKETGKPTFEAQLYDALDKLVGWLMAREWKREDGTVLRPERIPVDARDTDHAETVKLFCRRSAHAAVLLPSNGIYIGAKGSPLNDRKPVPGERRGWNWKIVTQNGSRVMRFDTNAWKTRMQSLLSAPAGGAGSVSLFGDRPEPHRMLADHLAAEKPYRLDHNGRVVTEWKLIPNRDNHWGDCFVGCGVAASVLGVDVVTAAPAGAKPRRPRNKVSYL